MAYTQPTEGDDIIEGDDTSELIDALGGNDVIDARAGDDTLIGGAGNDSLDGGGGSDVLRGGIGDDTYTSVFPEDTVIEAAGEGFDEIEFLAGWPQDPDVVVQIPLHTERFALWSSFDGITVQGNAQDNIILGNHISDESIWGGAGNDTIQGDFALHEDSADADFPGDDVLHGGDGDDLIWGDQGQLGGFPGNDLLFGDAGNDTLHGQGGYDLLTGGDGSDLLTGGEWMAGGAGDDVYLLARGSGTATIAETAAAGEANALRFGPGVLPGEVDMWRAGNDLVFDIAGYQSSLWAVQDYFSASRPPIARAEFEDGTVWEAAQFAAAPAGAPIGNLTIRGTADNDALQGGPRNDTIDGRNGWDHILGLDGDDLLRGGKGDDVIHGGSGRDALVGGDGYDFLDGGLGQDRMTGGPGDDTMVVDHALDRVVEKTRNGTDTVQSYIDYTLGNNLENLTLIGGTARLGIGNRLDNVLTGNDLGNELRGLGGNDVLDGGPGIDTLVGGPGDDTLFVDEPGDVVVELAGEGRDQVQARSDYELGANVEDLLLLTPARGIGNSVANVIVGSQSNDYIDGRGGIDTVDGHAGNDVIVMDHADEQISGGAGRFTDTLQLQAGLTLLDLTGRAGVSLLSLERIVLTNGEATTLVVSGEDVVALNPRDRQLYISGEAGDTVELRGEWRPVAEPLPGYNSYLAPDLGVVLVGVAVQVVQEA
jgi:Ca2+-binding RTX toxin-like protein